MLRDFMPNRWSFKRVLALWVLVGTTLGGCNLFSANPPNGAEPPSQADPATPTDPAIVDHAMTMDLGPKDPEFDLRFLDGMILHHQGAVTMAEAVLQNSSRSELKQLAEAIITAQKAEIAQMQQWRTDWYPRAGAEPMMYHADMGHSMAMSPEMQAAMQMSGDLGQGDPEFDLRFIDAMIPHHEGALVMAEQVLQNSDRPELQQLAQAILETQQAEINQMQQWKQSWYGQ